MAKKRGNETKAINGDGSAPEFRNFLPGLLLSAALLAPFASARAQEQQHPLAEPVADPAGEGSEIIVTANRRSQSLQDVAMSVSALGEQDLADFDVRSGVDIVRLVPGVFLSSAAAGQSLQYSIRGVTQNDFNDIFEGPIAVYYDDTYVPSQQGQVFGTFDLERVEVLKGPQGTLFGKNATGGLIHFIPKKPTEHFEGFADLSYGRFDSVRAEGAASGSLAPAVRGRASFLYSRQDEWLENVYPAGASFIPAIPPGPRFGEDLGGEDLLAGRLQLETDLSARFNLRLTGSAARLRLGTGPYSSRTLIPVFNDAGQHVDSIVPPPGTPDFLGYLAPPPGSYQTASDFARDDGFHFRSYDLSLHARHEFDGFDLIAVSSYKRFDKSIAVDIDGGAINFLGLGTDNVSDSFTHELRIAGTTAGGTKWSTGALYSHVSAESQIGFLAPTNSLSGGPSGMDLINQVEFRSTSYSVFGQIDQPLAEALTLVVGGRLIHERLRYDFRSDMFVNDDDYEIDTDVVIVPNIQPPFNGKEDDTLWAGKLALEYRAEDGSLLYASVNRGVKGGAFNGKLPDQSPPLSPEQIPYESETLYSYEVGAKTSLMGGLARLSAAAFYYDYKDYQTFALINASGIISNNDANAWGGEIDADFRFSNAFRAGLAMAYTKAEVQDVAVAAATPTAPAVLADVRPTFSPRFQASGNVAYDLPVEIMAGTLKLLADASYISDFYDNIRNFQGQRHDGYALVNVGLTWASADESWQIQAYVKNLFAEEYVETAFDIATLCGCSQIQYSKPRWWTVSLRKEL